MLRTMFGEDARRDEGRLKEVLVLAEELAARYDRTRGSGEKDARALRLITWTKSITSTFDELEQSVYCSERYAAAVAHEFVEEMGPTEEANYRRHLYFYKNSFIRVFSVLDKLGSLMNECFSLRTEQLKARYSYFTVLRRMRETRQHQELVRRLHDIKDKHREPLQDLRLMRNHEVHAMNTELLDENGRIRVRPHNGKEKIEDLRENVVMLRAGFEVVNESLYAVFQYCKKQNQG
jgi:hypothetical protein